ncbi:MAG: hypothetical protein ACK506_11005 [Pirellula sp.]|jgi:hypothetical protein
MADMISYTWEVLGHRSLNPDDFEDARTFIETERGPYPGKAVLLFREADASEIMGNAGPLSITIRKWIFEDDEWTEEESYEFHGYYPVHSRVPDGMDHTVVEVTLKDARKLLADVMVQRRFNVIIEVIDEDAEEFLYEKSTINGDEPWEFGEILQELFALSPLAPSVASADSSIPTNIVFQNESLASAIEKLLASKALAYVYELSTGIAKTVDLQSAGSREAIAAAIGEKRLKWDFHPDIVQPLEAEILPWSAKDPTTPITQLAWQSHSTSAGEPKKVVIQHFHPKVDDLNLLAEAWYKVIESPLDQILQGVVEQELNPALTHARFWYEKGESSSRFQNKLQKEIPWPTPPVSIYMGGKIEFDILSAAEAASGPYTGRMVATVEITRASSTDLIGETVDVVDHSGCVFDLDPAELIGYHGWASWGTVADGEEFAPFHWCADDRCCEKTGYGYGYGYGG